MGIIATHLVVIVVIAPLTFETANCLLPTYQGKHENVGAVCQWTEDNFETNFYLNKGTSKRPEYKWEMKKEYDKDNIVEKWVREQYWKRRDNGS